VRSAPRRPSGLDSALILCPLCYTGSCSVARLLQYWGTVMPRLELVLASSPADASFAAVLADALRATGARVWSEPFELQEGQLPQVVEQEVRHCPSFLSCSLPLHWRYPPFARSAHGRPTKRGAIPPGCSSVSSSHHSRMRLIGLLLRTSPLSRGTAPSRFPRRALSKRSWMPFC
jgi:hypothetical protein